MNSVNAQQVLMQGFYYDIPKAQCGAVWADTMGAKAAQLAGSGFTHIWTPPFQGNGPNSGGYDPKDLYIGTNSTLTALGTKQQILNMVSTFSSAGMQVVGDMIYNHRDGGAPETNDPVLDYVMNHSGNMSNQNCYQYAMPSDRYRLILPVGGSSGNGIGNYYVNISSRTNTYSGSQYMLYVTTNKIGGSRWSPVNPTAVVAPEQGPAYAIQLGTNYQVTIDSNGDNDEFQIALNTSDFNATDTLFIQMININPGDITSYSNHRPWKIWYDPLGASGNGSARDLAEVGTMFLSGGINPSYKLRAQTFTNFCGLLGGGPCMNGNNFRPNWSGDPASDVSATCLGPAWSQQSMDYFYDYDHQNPDTKQKLIDWTLWSWDQVGIRGLRMDAIKHFPASFVGDLLCAMHAAGKDPSLIVGEWYGQDPGPQGSWLNEVYNKLNACGAGNLNPKVFDFNLRDQLKKASDGGNGVSTSSDCNDSNSWDVRSIFTGSLHDGSGFSRNNVVTMLNNHDFRSTDPTFGDALIHDRADAINSYAYLLTNNHLGVPTVFWPDYYGYPATVTTWNGSTCVPQTYIYFPNWPQGGLKTEIDQLLHVLKTYISGSTGIDYLNKFGGPALNYFTGCYKRTLIYQNNASGSIGGKEVLNVINYSDQTADVEVPVVQRNGVASGVIFRNVAGTTSTTQPIVSSSGMLRVTVPAHSFGIWVQGAPLPSPAIYTVRNGLWNEPTTWSCNCLPTSSDVVQIKHNVTVPASYIGVALQINFDLGQKLIFESGAKVNVGQ
ncbi:alpha amylase [Spirosoma sp. BT702]|uniref:Alpha amylase n=1 Tax=Spirosoma profusum TaxID=2771354 RepID=A0A927ASF3_9BACT|nr:alpha-amylase family glycosyl hydrolase [Spirosoma profusum]MBD2703751.1 alpha amylase [Spirosoma profusum]